MEACVLTERQRGLMGEDTDTLITDPPGRNLNLKAPVFQDGLCSCEGPAGLWGGGGGGGGLFIKCH